MLSLLKNRIFFLLLLCFFFACKPRKVYHEIVQTNIEDPDIIIVNIGNASRGQIAELLFRIEESKPLLIGIDVVFNGHKSKTEDSLLVEAFKKIENDVIAFKIDSVGNNESSIEAIKINVKAEGHIAIEKDDSISRYINPIYEFDGKRFNSFALEIVRLWHSNTKYEFASNKSIPILFQRSPKQFKTFNLEELKKDSLMATLNGKVVLVGFTGSGDEDLHLTPVRNLADNSRGNSYMYGVIIQANIIRTLLTYNKKY